MSDKLTINGQIYGAENIGGAMWIVRWYKAEFDEGFKESMMTAPDGVTWTPEDAIRAAVARGSWG